jgi:hypothetical protein
MHIHAHARRAHRHHNNGRALGTQQCVHRYLSVCTSLPIAHLYRLLHVSCAKLRMKVVPACPTTLIPTMSKECGAHVCRYAALHTRCCAVSSDTVAAADYTRFTNRRRLQHVANTRPVTPQTLQRGGSRRRPPGPRRAKWRAVRACALSAVLRERARQRKSQCRTEAATTANHSSGDKSGVRGSHVWRESASASFDAAKRATGGCCGALARNSTLSLSAVAARGTGTEKRQVRRMYSGRFASQRPRCAAQQLARPTTHHTRSAPLPQQPPQQHQLPPGATAEQAHAMKGEQKRSCESLRGTGAHAARVRGAGACLQLAARVSNASNQPAWVVDRCMRLCSTRKHI